LDELWASCRAENAKVAFGEAVAAYRSGAYRACIVSTWTAVVFDYLGKLRELELSGNGEARRILESFENARRSHNVGDALKLEAQVLDDATARFELLSPIEKEDLVRLREDRHRCAHPSLLTLDEPYQPTAELARCHMRSAASHLLSRPPLQGREAWTRLWADISSDYFPEDSGAATERIQVRLSRARPTLVRQLAVELTQRLFDPASAALHGRCRAALLATTKLYHSDVERLLADKLAALAADVPDPQLGLVLSYCSSVGPSWSCLGSATQGRLTTFVERTEDGSALADALEVNALRHLALSRVGGLDDDGLATFAGRSRRVDVLDELVGRFADSKSFSTFRDLRSALRNEGILQLWTATHRQRLTAALAQNPELRRYGGYPGAIREVLRLFKGIPEAEAEWRSVHAIAAAHSWSKLRCCANEVRVLFPSLPEVDEDSTGDAAADVEREDE